MTGNQSSAGHIQYPARFDREEFCGNSSIDILFRHHFFT
jgi:hypothetical protein